MPSVKIYTKKTLIEKLKEVKQMGWIPNVRRGNSGSVGNTLEDLLGIQENNLPIPNAAEWELKCQRAKTRSLVTLFHVEPSPRALRFVPKILLPIYGWSHKQAGKKYSENEMSFRQTISSLKHTDRGFKVVVDKKDEKVSISFDRNFVAEKHKDWLHKIIKKTNGSELNPQPYWGFKDLYHKAGTKLHNCFFVKARSKKENGKEFFNYEEIWMLSEFSLEKFIMEIERGNMLVDFDARTGHNHGTKFRFRNNRLLELYQNVLKII